jgi:hypothetical protein
VSDYFVLELRKASKRRHDRAALSTVRVLTIMRADEY